MRTEFSHSYLGEVGAFRVSRFSGLCAALAEAEVVAGKSEQPIWASQIGSNWLHP